MIEAEVRKQRQQRDILLMTHVVLGYPSFDTGFALLDEMVQAGVSLVELQIPFSEPVADGPVILHANQRALEAGATVEKCLRFAEEAARRFEVPLLFMSYYNILFKFGVPEFVREMKRLGIRGAIVPDLPPEEAEDYLAAMAKHELDPIFIFSPRTSDERMRKIAPHGRGFVYCVARRGVTGSQTEFSDELTGYLARCRAATSLPLAVGFGVRSRADVEYLTGLADIAVVGSETIRLVEAEGTSAVGRFMRELLG